MIGAELERRRLEDRAGRMEQVLAALRERGVYRHAETGRTPAPLGAAIEDFSAELSRVRSKLAEIRE
jgi:hypothetical protein